jgi:hypothetical protein
MNSLNRETTIPKRSPDALSLPARVLSRMRSSVDFSVPEPLLSEVEGCFSREMVSVLYAGVLQKLDDNNKWKSAPPARTAEKNLTSFEMCRSLFQECRRAFLLIFGG